MSADHMVQSLVDRLPIMKAGKPRRFRLWCECYEWTFNQTAQQWFRATPDNIAQSIERATRVAGALWDHQRDNPDLFAFPHRARAQ